MTQALSYTASSLADIAEAFEALALSAEAEAKSRVITQLRRTKLLACADTWRDAAQMLRNTKLLGGQS